MDWQRVIERNRVLLGRVIAMMFAIAGLEDRESVDTVSRGTRNYLMRLLRPAESALRRMIVIAARDLETPALPSRGEERLSPHKHGKRPGKRANKAKEGDSMATTIPSFPIMDPRKRFDFNPPRRYATTFPRITCIGLSEPTPIPERCFPMPDDPVDAARLCRRLQRLKHALANIDIHARRLARWKARRDAGRTKYLSPMRPGYAPGRRKRGKHEVDEILRDLQSLALYSESPDSS